MGSIFWSFFHFNGDSLDTLVISMVLLLYLSCLHQVKMPDVEFYINVGDWPMENRKVNDKPGPVPIISWCGSTDTRDIILPTYDITHSSLEAMRGVTNDLLSVQGNTGASSNISSCQSPILSYFPLSHLSGLLYWFSQVLCGQIKRTRRSSEEGTVEKSVCAWYPCPKKIQSCSMRE